MKGDPPEAHIDLAQAFVTHRFQDSPMMRRNVIRRIGTRSAESDRAIDRRERMEAR